MKKRLFIAISFPEKLVQEFADHEVKLKKFMGDGARFTPPENFHLTPHFIGYLNEERLPALQATITEALREIKTFEVSFKEITFAPPGKTRRMIWVVFESREYEELSKKLAHLLREFTQKEGPDRPVVPHLTLARFKEPSLAKGTKLPAPKVSLNSFTVSSVELMESKLSPKGPTYTVVESYKLQ